MCGWVLTSRDPFGDNFVAKINSFSSREHPFGAYKPEGFIPLVNNFHQDKDAQAFEQEVLISRE